MRCQGQSLSNVTYLSKYKFTAIVLDGQLAPDEKSQLGEIEAEKDRGGKLADCFHHNIIIIIISDFVDFNAESSGLKY